MIQLILIIESIYVIKSTGTNLQILASTNNNNELIESIMNNVFNKNVDFYSNFNIPASKKYKINNFDILSESELFLKSPNGTRYKITVSDAGQITSTII